MRWAIVTLVLNEMEWLPRLYQQHKDFPGLDKWVFVESADRVYANTNNKLVTSDGLSVDGTSDFLQELADRDDRVIYIPHGFCDNVDKAQGKCEARNRYLEYLEDIRPNYILQLDADEFWTKKSQQQLDSWVQPSIGDLSFSFNHREIWHPICLSDEPLFKYEVVGGFWDILYCRVFRFIPNMRYTQNHNTPSIKGTPLTQYLKDHRRVLSNHIPEYVHMGFAVNNIKMRIAKNEYYRMRGEKDDPRRRWYTDSRACFETWKPGERLPKGARVIEYNGAIPEVFIDE